MTISERAALLSATAPLHDRQTAQGADDRPRPISTKETRIQAKLFRNKDPSLAISEMNDWLNKMMGDGRVNVVNCESQVWPRCSDGKTGMLVSEQELLLTVFYTIR
jgi:hypothetical protein